MFDTLPSPIFVASIFAPSLILSLSIFVIVLLSASIVLLTSVCDNPVPTSVVLLSGIGSTLVVPVVIPDSSN